MIFRTDPRNVVITLLCLVLFFAFDGCSRIGSLFNGEEVVETKTTTTIKKDVKKHSFIDLQPFPEIFKPTKQKVKLENGKITEVPLNTPVDSSEKQKVREVNKYQIFNELPNGTIKGTLLIKGELLSTGYELTTTDTTITKETETIRTVVKSGLFGVGGSTIGLDGRLKDIQAGFSYVHKNRWYVETGVQYDVDPKIYLPPQDRAGVLVKVGFKF